MIYSGVAHSSKGIIMVASSSTNSVLLPAKRYLEKANAARLPSRMTIAVCVAVMNSEFAYVLTIVPAL